MSRHYVPSALLSRIHLVDRIDLLETLLGWGQRWHIRYRGPVSWPTVPAFGLLRLFLVGLGIRIKLLRDKICGIWSDPDNECAGPETKFCELTSYAGFAVSCPHCLQAPLVSSPVCDHGSCRDFAESTPFWLAF